MIKKLKNIKIQENFEKNQPKVLKMLEKINYFLENGKFEQPIVINKEGYLVDGYTTYLICRFNGRKYVNVKRIKR